MHRVLLVCVFILCAHFCLPDQVGKLRLMSSVVVFVLVSNASSGFILSLSSSLSLFRLLPYLHFLSACLSSTSLRPRSLFVAKPRSHDRTEPEGKVRKTCRHSISRLRHPPSAIAPFLSFVLATAAATDPVRHKTSSRLCNGSRLRLTRPRI